ncbi:aminodeoxychorismate lyase [Amycolatopsis keratiniphila]|uniref:aminodeoxychorismate lyase n=1 Tax=Amycolatopsis keratiniphila TaxID=129921 RepID=UPI000879F91F|nr:aminodeoxychorismate lyase [Amycolatopsis keratiniphila]OLZ60232.1 4-amino-4-deoxychorismate lyase [Amycolatopsis keratiniphila subsp. nogabecina]SDU58329.1 4-amino-4-deoxychorismate lyase [Amycolatopsis keratiniphila]
MRVLAFLDGTLADPEAAHLRVDDLGLLRGDGVFETILVVDGRPRELRPHLERLARSAAMLDLPEPDLAVWERAAQVVIDNWSGPAEIALKLVYTRGIDGDPEAKPFGFALGVEIDEKVQRARVEGVAAITLERGIEADLAERAPWLLLGAKSISYGVNMAALREAGRRGASDVIFTAADGSVFEGPTSTVVLAKDKTLYTPPATIGILPGTTQAALFRGAERAGWSVKVEPLNVSDLTEGEGLFLASSVRKLTRVHTLDGVALTDSSAIHAELAAAYESEYAIS